LCASSSTRPILCKSVLRAAFRSLDPKTLARSSQGHAGPSLSASMLMRALPSKRSPALRGRPAATSRRARFQISGADKGLRPARRYRPVQRDPGSTTSHYLDAMIICAAGLALPDCPVPRRGWRPRARPLGSDYRRTRVRAVEDDGAPGRRQHRRDRRRWRRTEARMIGPRVRRERRRGGRAPT